MKKNSRPSKKSRVYLVDANETARGWLARLIDAEADLAVCGGAPNAAQAVDKMTAAAPDVAVVSLDAPGESLLGALSLLRWNHPRVPVVALSLRDGTYGRRILQAGAAGFVSKSTAARAVVPAIRRVLRGGVYSQRKRIILRRPL
jgi:two-component system invasion response regulator UvrY